MTSKQKTIATYLLTGGYIAKCPPNNYRLRTSDHHVVSKFYDVTFSIFKELLRRDKDGLFLLDRNKVRQLHGSAWIKQEYYKIRKESIAQRA